MRMIKRKKVKSLQFAAPNFSTNATILHCKCTLSSALPCCTVPPAIAAAEINVVYLLFHLKRELLVS